ncbi:hypothetical protein ARTHRO9AX_220073 [Arthrobacter sp. 9AX]|nr:hypothetical protein ARTHRO9AX_220073 [Arthrobacter sp. 9AX]
MLGRLSRSTKPRTEAILPFDVNPILIGLDGTITAVDARVERRV